MVLERTHNLRGAGHSHDAFELCFFITCHLVQFLSMVPPGQKALHRGDRWPPVREREYSLERNLMPFRPPMPGTFHNTSRVDQRTVHIEQHCAANERQWTEIPL